jgi:predicted enzyme related to lactoylglutathione lyase
MNTLASIVYTVNDLEAAKAVHTALLGVEPHTDQPYYIGYNVGGFEIALVPQRDNESSNAPVAFVHVSDLEAAIAEVQRAGASLLSGPQDVGGGTRTATLTDAGGNILGLIHRS